MQLSKVVQQRLSQEYSFASEKMQESPDLPTKLYYFSVFFAEANRALNVEWDPDIALLHLVLQSVHQTVTVRLANPMPGLGFPTDFAEALTKASMHLAEIFKNREIDEQALYQVLTKCAELAYVMTGNGYYLYVRGSIKF
jgi:hypothetical protein